MAHTAKCKGCGSDLTLMQYQARSADEAHSSSYRCPFCPLDITKFSNLIPVPHLYLKKSKRSRPQTPVVNSNVSFTRRLLCVVSKDLSLFQGSNLSVARSSNCLDTNSRLYKHYTTGPWKGMAVSYGERMNIGLNAYLVSLSLIPMDTIPDNQYSDFKYTSLEGYTVIVQNNSAKLICDVGTESDSAVLDHLLCAYVMGFAPTSLASHTSGVRLGAMSNMNARAYDAVSGEDNKDSFSTKPDGERMWLVRAGSTWLYCKRMNFEIRSWEIDNALMYSNDLSVSPVIDIEFMLAFDPILIDVIVSSNMEICPYDRDLQWIEKEMCSLRQEFQYLSIVQTRKFFNTHAEASVYEKSVQYPTDGLIAISPNGTDMKKLKPLKSIELKLQDNNELTTREGKALFRMAEDSVYVPDDIVEIRFSILNGVLNTHETFHRPDKIVPNNDSAVQAVIASCAKPESDSMLRTIMWRWSNKLRFYLYEKANSVDNDNNIVLDIGSGSGQSTEAFDKLPDCSFILIEPDEDACRSLSRRLGVKEVHKDPRSVIGVIPQLKRGTRKYHILNCQLDDVLSDKPVVSNIKSILRCAISCFSAHYIATRIDDIVGLGIPFVGCYYSYDGVELGESIINTSGISMTRVSHNRAVVKWGRDKEYNEPVVLPEEEPVSVTTVSALDVVSLDASSQDQRAYKACSSVKILICT
jgi:hypothetical protein